MSEKTILYHQEDGVATVTFNRPDKLNALNGQMKEELREIINRVAAAPDIRVLIFTGKGRAFMAGADVSMFLDLDPLSGKHLAQRAQELLARLESLEIPVIAAVNGLALGGGLELAMACDLIYASGEAKFGQPEINLGLLPFVGGTQRLTRLVGKVVAKELCFTGRMMDAQEAKTLGLVARVIPGDSLMAEVNKIAHILAQKPRVALRAIKQVIDRGFDLDLRNACALETDAVALCLSSPDAREGVSAFLEKRPPRFSRTFSAK